MANALTEMHERLTRTSIKAYMTTDGEPAPVLLGELALMLGIGAEIGMNRVPDAPETRRMHAALRTVLQMGVNGGRWMAAQAPVLHEAASLAVTAFEAYPELGIRMFPGAAMLAHDIRMGTARMDAVAGSEIYAKQLARPELAGVNSH